MTPERWPCAAGQREIALSNPGADCASGKVARGSASEFIEN